jgi:hypothetical protein
MAKEVYEALNEQLTTEIPQLIDLRVPYLDPSFEALVKIQLRCESRRPMLCGAQGDADFGDSLRGGIFTNGTSTAILGSRHARAVCAGPPRPKGGAGSAGDSRPQHSRRFIDRSPRLLERALVVDCI